MSDQRPDERPKRIVLEIEWRGACSERDWICHLVDLIEKYDRSRTTLVTEAHALTDYGTTEVIPVARLRELGYKPLWDRDPWYMRCWLRLWWRLRWRLWWRR